MRHSGAVIVFVCAALLSSYPALAQFTEEGPKLVGTGARPNAQQGFQVPLAADGNTAIVGGRIDSVDGAAWVWTKSGGVWTQQGAKLVGSGAVGDAQQGISASLSADGNTAMVGGYFDNNGDGAAWVWTRSGGAWTQQGTKLVGSGAAGKACPGESPSLPPARNSADCRGLQTGAARRSSELKLVGSGAVGDAQQGVSVSLSADGNTAMVGGDGDNNGVGAAWVWTRSGGVWTQLGSKVVGSGAVGLAEQGSSVSLSGDGNTAISGGLGDNRNTGAAWGFAINAAAIPALSDRALLALAALLALL